MSFKDLEQKHNLVNMVILACGKHPVDADINPLLEERLERFYEDAVIEGMAKQMHSSVDRAVNAMGKELVKPDPVVLFTDNEEGLCIQLACDGAYYWQNLSDFDSAKFFVDAYRGRK